MTDILGIAEARERLDSLCRKAATSLERTAITDEGTVVAILISPQELADLEDDLAIAQNRLNEALGQPEPVLTQEEFLNELAAQDVDGQQGAA
ncbi:type II toxin-antitoxin system Phd/YefM family antitoxin [Streptomyces sp. NA04227]|uniref:type II toxin-antitoxin system Phd/YefM family antitoxin n=1 Tax=Streptomyces sp. NA04227 TaxID=2742136 RepID=UPI00158FBE46|nr:type II toxin-antitoxin system Phd/YefM family antitoxin [Streptomyces sp. NA04227]QKW07225.1 type II toxin-antitoxin system Phd/YefM family antitoxin [Streptomyces sp. NA04227]